MLDPTERLSPLLDVAAREHDARPFRASIRAVSKPMPVFAPVTIALRPVWSGMSSKVQAFIELTPLGFEAAGFIRSRTSAGVLPPSP